MSITQLPPAVAWQTWQPSADQPWDVTRAAHLYRRAGFGANWQQLQTAVKSSPADIVSGLVDAHESKSLAEEMKLLGGSLRSTGDTASLSAWWLHRMLRTDAPLLEQLTLCWHDHFATSAEKVKSTRMMIEHFNLLHDHALGDFRALVHDISRDPAMLVWLDSATNRKRHPNENYARELMELFCLGEGNYTEDDIKQLARCFTGWEVRRGQFRFNQSEYDDGQKKILGESQKFDGDAAIDVVLGQDQAPLFIARKLVSWLVTDSPFEDAFVQPVADHLQKHDYNIAAAVKLVLGSKAFFASETLGGKVRSPVELAVGVLRSLDGRTNTQSLASKLETLGQLLFYPPNVAGWPEGKEWINASTLLARVNLLTGFARGGETKFSDGSLEDWAAAQELKSSADIVDRLSELLLAVKLGDATRAQIIALADKSDQPAETAFTSLAALPEMQLA